MRSYRIETSKKLVSFIVAITVSTALAIATPAGVMADGYDDQISALKAKVEGYQAATSKLSEQADTLSNKIDTLNAQKQTLQAQIALNEAKHEKLVKDIADNQARLQKQKDFLGKTLATMYVQSSVTPLEMVASSKSIGDYLNQYEYRNAVRSQIQSSISQVKSLNQQLEQQQTDVKNVIADQQSQKATLAAQQQEQQQLLADTKGQEANYQKLTVDRNAQVADLRQQQAEANMRALAAAQAAARTAAQASAAGGGNAAASVSAAGAVPGSVPIPSGSRNGGYPDIWANAPKDTLIDSWGMYNRECVSYTAFKVNQAGKHMPYWGGHGNANQWPGSARASGIATGLAPRAGAVAILMVGPYGHAMYVERVNGNGTILVSQYNYSVDGNYSMMTISGAGLTYIYF